MIEYWHLVDDLGEDFYRVDLSNGDVWVWNSVVRWEFVDFLKDSDLQEIGTYETVTTFEQVTEDDLP